MKNIDNGYKQFEVTFTNARNKYSPVTRTVEIQGLNEYHVTMMAHQMFGSFSKVHPVLIPSNRIKIDNCVEVKVEEVVEELVEVEELELVEA